MRTISGRLTLAAAALAVLSAPGGASAQIWVGQIAGDMVARQIEAQKRQDCAGQTGSAIGTWVAEGPAVDAAMKAFVTAAVNGDGKRVKAMVSRRKEGGLRAPDGTFVAPGDFRLPSGGELTRSALVFEIYGSAARGVWVQAAADPGGPPVYLTADLIKSFGSGWKIWRLSAASAPEAESFAPGSYCYGAYGGGLPPLWVRDPANPTFTSKGGSKEAP